MTIFHRLSWKLTLVTGLLVLVTILAIAIPLYWLTRNSLEDQLTDHLQNNIINASKEINFHLMQFVNQYPTAMMMRDSLAKSLQQLTVKYSAVTIYIINTENHIIASGGSINNAIQSVLIHELEIEKARNAGIGFSPLFSDNTGNSYKSAFLLLPSEETPKMVLGFDANAQFLQYARQLQKRVMLIGIIVLAISIVAVLILSQTLTHPLRELTIYANNIGKGHTEPTQQKERKDEIGFLGKTMEEMHLQIQQREKENKQLIASVAHEIRNPLAGMQVNVELLLEETHGNKDLYIHSKAIASEIEKLSEIIENFLTYARPIEANLSLHSLQTLLIDLLPQIQQDFPEHKVEISGNATALVNPNKIKHALSNLLKNACEASDTTVPICVSIQEGKSKISVFIKNQGFPITEDIRNRIFDIFFSTKESGVGLGLSITKSIIEQHSGTIRLEHSDSSGTEFVIELPTGSNGK